MHHARGSGTLNIQNENIDKIFTKELIERSVKTQKELLKKAVKILKKDGELIYSTCSILKEENEEIIEEILKNSSMEIVPIDKEIFKDVPLLAESISGTICVLPTALYEGFFVCKLKKKL